jgi:hypothetical protein
MYVEHFLTLIARLQCNSRSSRPFGIGAAIATLGEEPEQGSAYRLALGALHAHDCCCMGMYFDLALMTPYRPHPTALTGLAFCILPPQQPSWSGFGTGWRSDAGFGGRLVPHHRMLWQ